MCRIRCFEGRLAAAEVLDAGIDIGESGNVDGITRELRDQWPTRVRGTPISETAIMGLGVRAAMTSYTPVLELMYFDFPGVCLDQIMDQAAMLAYITGGQAQMALTLRTQIGAGRSSGAQHSQSLEAVNQPAAEGISTELIGLEKPDRVSLRIDDVRRPPHAGDRQFPLHHQPTARHNARQGVVHVLHRGGQDRASVQIVPRKQGTVSTRF